MLFHHRAKIGCLAWIRTKTIGVKTRHAAVTPQGKKVVEPEVVATSPYPIKSRVPVCCGFSSKKWWAREDWHLQGSQILDLWGLVFPLNHSPGNWCSWPESHRQPQPSEGCALIIELQELLAQCQQMEPPDGAAPSRLAYKESPRAAARRQAEKNSKHQTPNSKEEPNFNLQDRVSALLHS